jgi:ATP-binding cassette subfamily F protein uup
MRELGGGCDAAAGAGSGFGLGGVSGRVVHVASYATKFLFTSEQLNQPVERLSGGERARVLIAKLMLEPADLLLLDEPTNDLDIATLEILEESLLEYTGALVLVTHDRYMLDRVSTIVLGLDGRGGAETFADYSQWEQWRGCEGRRRLLRGLRAAGCGSAVAVEAPAAQVGRRSCRIWRRGSMRGSRLRWSGGGSAADGSGDD